MNTDSFVAPVWQLMVNGVGVVPNTAKYHCFVDDRSLCEKYYQDTKYYDDGICCEQDAVAENLQYVCKRCYSKWKCMYQIGENENG